MQFLPFGASVSLYEQYGVVSVVGSGSDPSPTANTACPQAGLEASQAVSAEGGTEDLRVWGAVGEAFREARPWCTVELSF